MGGGMSGVMKGAEEDEWSIEGAVKLDPKRLGDGEGNFSARASGDERKAKLYHRKAIRL
jgi:hypothetical protein